MIRAAEALAPSTSVVAACNALGVPRATLYRHRNPLPRRPLAQRACPRALGANERAEVLNTLHEQQFVDRAPASVYATLLEQGVYFCSIRTMYRILEAEGEVKERRRQARHPRREPPRLVTRAPNEVWSWDITRLPGPRKWSALYLYVILDLFSRYVVAWMVAQRETAELAKRLVREACRKEQIEPGQLTLHQDRGAPMRAKTFSQLLIDLDILASYSRPRVSDDNPYSESHFKTLKNAPSYPGKIEDSGQARTFLGPFFDWYNTKHRHAGLGLLTPEAVHYGRAAELQVERQRVLEAAYATHPERFVHGRPQAPRIPTEVWINRPATPGLVDLKPGGH
jgi:putative transposase